jgi:membrane fusion protein (multidrug efflux system)
VKQQVAALEQQRARLRQAQITAPFSGTVAERYRNPGMTAGPSRAVVRLISNKMLWARFAAPAERAPELILESDVRVVVTGLGQELNGMIRQIGSEVDPASGMIICEAVVNWPDGWNGPPLSGQAVRIWLE